MANPKYLRISIDDPCKVPWEGMTPVEKEQRFCSSCERVITDFSKMSDDELMLYFIHSKGKICGRFSNQQLNRPMPLLPVKTQPARWWRTMLLLPLALFSKSARAQYYQVVNGSDKADTTAVVAAKDSVMKEEVVQADSVSNGLEDNENDSLKTELVELKKDDSVLLKTSSPQDSVHLVTITDVNGMVDITMGICYNPPIVVRPEDFSPPRKRKNFNDGKISDVPRPEDWTDEPEKTPEPQKPALPANSDLSAVLPEQRKRFWKS